MNVEPMIVPKSQGIENPIDYTIDFVEWIMSFDGAVDWIMSLDKQETPGHRIHAYSEWIEERAFEKLKKDGKSPYYTTLLTINTAKLVYNIESGKYPDIRSEEARNHIYENMIEFRAMIPITEF